MRTRGDVRNAPPLARADTRAYCAICSRPVTCVPRTRLHSADSSLPYQPPVLCSLAYFLSCRELFPSLSISTQMFRQSLSVLCASTGRAGRLSALSAPAVTQALQSLPGWHTDGNAINTIRRDFVFRDFGEAMNFMVRVAPFCDANDHHPNWMNVYNRVGVRLTTHDLGNKVSRKDVDLARHMNDVYSGMREANHAQK